MKRICAWLALCGIGGLAACSSEPAPTGGDGGTSQATGGGGASGAGAAAGGAPSAGSAGSAGNGGSAGSVAGGGAGPAGGAAGTGGAGSGGGGNASSGSGGSGGDSSTPVLPKRVLLYHFSTLVIASVPAQITLLKNQLQAWGYEVEDSVAPADLSSTNLARFGGVGMINTCFEPFGAGKMGDAETAALKAFVEGGGGLFGTHCASVTFQSAQPPHAYNALIGGRGGDGYFNGTSACNTEEQHPTTAQLPATFSYTGDLDNADYVAPDAKVLVKCKWSGGEMKETAVSWYRTPGKGRVFFTNFAKEDDDLSDATLGAKHILPGLGWVLGR
jgi:type 1 glutamine amidotransferase